MNKDFYLVIFCLNHALVSMTRVDSLVVETNAFHAGQKCFTSGTLDKMYYTYEHDVNLSHKENGKRTVYESIPLMSFIHKHWDTHGYIKIRG